MLDNYIFSGSSLISETIKNYCSNKITNESLNEIIKRQRAAIEYDGYYELENLTRLFPYELDIKLSKKSLRIIQKQKNRCAREFTGYWRWYWNRYKYFFPILVGLILGKLFGYLLH